MTTKNKKRPFAQDFSGDSKTQQHFTESCDVNNIVAAFITTGVDPNAERALNKKYGYASSQDFSEAMQNVSEIRSAFAELSSDVRQAHGNDPARWIDSLVTPPKPDDPIVDPEATQEPSDPKDPEPKKPEPDPKSDST